MEATRLFMRGLLGVHSERVEEFRRGRLLDERIPLICALSTSRGYGMQEMTYATASGLRDQFRPVIFTPAGPSVDEARKRGFDVVVTRSLGSGDGGGLLSPQSWEFGLKLLPFLAKHKRVALLGTRCMHSIIFGALNVVLRRDVANFHVVHGVEEDSRWAQKRVLDRIPFPLTIVAVSEYARERMSSYGLRHPVELIENYLTDERRKSIPVRGVFEERGVKHAAVVSRLDPAKRLDVLLDCLEQCPQLNDVTYHLYGDGPERGKLEARAAARGLNVRFEGFCANISAELIKADVLVHTGPLEILPLALLEAMAAGLPILAPDQGGAACVVEDGVNGMTYRACDPHDLGEKLAALINAEPGELNRLVAGGYRSLSERFTEKDRLAQYRSSLWRSLSSPMHKTMASSRA